MAGHRRGGEGEGGAIAILGAGDAADLGGCIADLAAGTGGRRVVDAIGACVTRRTARGVADIEIDGGALLAGGAVCVFAAQDVERVRFGDLERGEIEGGAEGGGRGGGRGDGVEDVVVEDHDIAGDEVLSCDIDGLACVASEAKERIGACGDRSGGRENLEDAGKAALARRIADEKLVGSGDKTYQTECTIRPSGIRKTPRPVGGSHINTVGVDDLKKRIDATKEAGCRAESATKDIDADAGA